jgi:hypothetical protein
MDRALLDNYSLEKLKREEYRHRYRLPIINDRDTLIDSIMSHFEHNSPAEDVQLGARTRGQARPRKESATSDQIAQERMELPSATETSANTSTLEIVVKSLQICIEQQRDMMMGVRALTECHTNSVEPINPEVPLTRLSSGQLPTFSTAQATTLDVANTRIRGNRR